MIAPCSWCGRPTREIAKALIDAAANAEGIDMPPLYRECEDGNQYEADGLGGE